MVVGIIVVGVVGITIEPTRFCFVARGKLVISATVRIIPLG